MKLTSLIAVLAFAFVANAQEPTAPAAASTPPAVHNEDTAQPADHMKKDKMAKKKKHGKKDKETTH